MKRAVAALLIGCTPAQAQTSPNDHTVARWEAAAVAGSPASLDDTAALSLGLQGTHEPSVRLSTLDGDGRAWWLASGHIDFITPDRLLNLGWNVRGTGGPLDTTAHAWAMGFEHRYDRPEPAHDLAEWHIHYWSPGSAVYRRPVSAAVDLVTNSAQVALSGDVILQDEAGGMNLRSYYGSGTFAYRDVRLFASANLRIGGKVGFYDTPPAAKPTVTGDDAETICRSLVDSLESLGLVTDGTTP